MFPLVSKSAQQTSGCSSFSFLKSMHILCLGGSPGADFLGTTTIGLAYGLMLFLMTPTHSKVSISCRTQE